MQHQGSGTFREYIWKDYWPIAKRRLAENTQRKYVPVLHGLTRHLGDVPIDQLDRSDFESWLESPWMSRNRLGGGPCAPSTLRARLYIARRVLGQFARRFGMDDILPDIQPPSRDSGAEHYVLSLANFQKFMKVARRPSGWYAEILMIAGTGVRLPELDHVRLRDVDHDDRVVRIGPEGDERWIPLTTIAEEAVGAAKERLRGTLTGDTLLFRTTRWCSARRMLRREMRRVSEDLRLPSRVTPRVLRRSFHHLCSEAGVDPRLIGIILGHKGASDHPYAMIDRRAYVSDGVDVVDAALDADGVIARASASHSS